jgi:hypothetical protein
MTVTVLKRWKALKDSDGIQRTQRFSRHLSLAALLLCFPVAYGCLYGGLPSWLLVAMSITIGWLLAERNALDNRVKLWPTINKYIDWSHVDRDLCADDRSYG